MNFYNKDWATASLPILALSLGFSLCASRYYLERTPSRFDLERSTDTCTTLTFDLKVKEQGSLGIMRRPCKMTPK